VLSRKVRAFLDKPRVARRATVGATDTARRHDLVHARGRNIVLVASAATRK
jgi:hypothetical protein